VKGAASPLINFPYGLPIALKGQWEIHVIVLEKSDAQP
jgi:hypothetical protein